MREKITILLELTILLVCAMHNKNSSGASILPTPSIASNSFTASPSFTPQPKPTNGSTTISPTPAVVPSQTQVKDSSDDLLIAIITGVLTLSGTILGVVISYWLTLRRDKLLREEKEKTKIRDDLTRGADKIAEAHSRARLPFNGGQGLSFPSGKVDIDKEMKKLINNIQELLARAEVVKAEKAAIELLEFSLNRVEEYVQNKESIK